MKIKTNAFYRNTPFIKLKKGDVRIMFDDGKGLAVMDFEKGGSLNKFLKEFVYKEYDTMKKSK